MTILDYSKVISRAPDHPGVYRFIDKNENIIYIGKAKSLINRLRQYQQGRSLDQKTLWMLKRAESCSWLKVENEKDALILEHDLIKQYRPFYNILLKDDKTYPYVCITRHEFSALIVCRQGSDSKR